MESQLKKAALVLTALLLLQLLWSGSRLLLLSEPESIFPAESSLRLAAVRTRVAMDDEVSGALVARPLFWQDRRPYVADAPPTVDSVTPAAAGGGKSPLDEVELLGVYKGSGAKSGIIIAYQGERRRLNLKDSIDGWTFTMMSTDSAVFEKGKERRALDLRHSTAVVAASSQVDDRKQDDRKQDATNNDEKTGE